MTMSLLALTAKRVIENAWLHGAPYDLASQAAFALESAQLLQSPETAAEGELSAKAVRVAEDSVVELRREHEENARLREALRKACDEVARLESELGGATARASEEQRASHFTEAARLLEATGRDDDSVNLLDNVAAGIRSYAAPLEDPHDGPLAHSYRLGRDLPELGGAR